MKAVRIAATAMLLAFTVAAAQAQNPCNPCGKKGATHFRVNDPMARNHATFKSSAPLEDIVGTSRDITGHLVFDPNKPAAGGHGEVSITVASLNTGIPLRDEHLRGGDWLDAANYPKIMLTIKQFKNVTPVKSTPEAQTYDVVIVGELSLHGKTKAVEISGRLTYLKESAMTKQAMEGDLLAARASFDVGLKDFGITGPKGMNLVGSKVGEVIEVDISFRASNSMQMAGNPCNPCGGKQAKNPCNPCGDKKAKNPCNPCGMK